MARTKPKNATTSSKTALSPIKLPDEIDTFIKLVDQILGNAREAEKYLARWERDQLAGKQQVCLPDGQPAHLAIGEEYEAKTIALAGQMRLMGKALASKLSNRYPDEARSVMFLVNCFPGASIDVDSSEQLPFNTKPDWLPIKSAAVRGECSHHVGDFRK